MTSLILSGQNIIPIPLDTTSQWIISRGYNDGVCANWHNSIDCSFVQQHQHAMPFGTPRIAKKLPPSVNEDLNY